MKLLNRSAVKVLPQQAFVDWINCLPLSVSELEQPLSLAEYQAEGHIYLLDETEDPLADMQQSRHWLAIFDNELSAWDEFADHWPERSYDLFCQWFQLEPQQLVFDIASDALLLADLGSLH